MAWDNTSQITSNDGNSLSEVTRVGYMITLKTILPLVRCSLARLVSQRGHMAGCVKLIQWF